MHLLGQIEVKVFIHKQALIFTTYHIHIMCIPRIHVRICIVQDRRRKHPWWNSRIQKGESCRRCPGMRSKTWSYQSAPITSLACSRKASPGAFHSLRFVNNLIMSFMFDALSYRNCLEPLLHIYIYIFLVYLVYIPFTLLSLGLS
jgi:hypothetical protein